MIKISRHIKSTVNDIKRRVMQVIRYGNDDVIEIEQSGDFGIDSNPPKDTPLVIGKTDRLYYVIGSINGFKKADYGETRVFSTDVDGKEIKAFIHLKNDEEIHISGDQYSAVRFQELEKAFNELKDDHNDLVQKWNTFTTSYLPGSPTTVGTPPTLAGQNATPSTANISSAESKTIKLK